ncbi:MAG: DUF1178 family protein [Pseudomonadota bacterium]
MIKYTLRCDANHEFEGWFRASDDFDAQAADGRLSCPVCGSSEVRKAIMAPAVARTARPAANDAARAEKLAKIREAIRDAAGRARAYVEKNFDYVGPSFPEEARRIHYGETPERRIYGEASGEEARALADEGVEIAPLPAAPKTDRAAGPAMPAPDADADDGEPENLN